MPLRHIPRPSERDRHIEQPQQPPHNIIHPQHPPPPPHLNGNAAPNAVNIPPAHPHPNTSIVSPTIVANNPPNGQAASAPLSAVFKLAAANEQTWLLIGRIAEQMGDLEHAQSAYENALRHNPMSLSGLTQVAGIARIKENYPMAVEYFQRVISMQEDNGEIWSALGHCYLMQDDLQKAYSAYQQALYLLPNPKEDPKLWYGIGILYDRYGSLDHAEEAFSSVLKMDKDLDFDKANEILFRLGIIYKQQGKYEDSLACFDRILRNPPSPLAHADIWFQIGHVYEQQKDYGHAKDAYERVVSENPGHAKVLQQLGWLYHQDGSSFQNQELAIQYLTKSLEADGCDAQSWYLLGRAYMAGQKYNKAYEAYQQAVYRDGRNPTFWCSIGVLYFQINQFRDALDAYSRAIRINPYISEVWFDLGSLYESCNNQITDAIDAYARASELDPTNPVISQRLQLLRNAQATGGTLPAAPGPQDVHPTAYASAVVPPPSLGGMQLIHQGHRNADSRVALGDPNAALPPPSQVAARSSPGPFRGGPPPPVIIDESRQAPSHTQLAPMEVDRPPVHGRDYPGPPREGPSRGPVGHQNILLHHPVPQQQLQVDDVRNGGHGHHQDPFFNRPPLRVPSPSASPTQPHPSRGRSPLPAFQAYPLPSRQPSGPGQPVGVPQRSPRHYPPEPGRMGPVEPEGGWDRRGIPDYNRDWERERRPRQGSEYPQHPQQTTFRVRSPPQLSRSPDRSPHALHPAGAHWESKPLSGPSVPPVHSRGSPPRPQAMGIRYDPRHDVRDQHESEGHSEQRQAARPHSGSPHLPRHASQPQVYNVAPRPGTESPRPAAAAESKERRKRPREKEPDIAPLPPIQVPDQGQKKERKKRSTNSRRVKEEPSRPDSPRAFSDRLAAGPSGSGSGPAKPPYSKGVDTPESIANGSASSGRSGQASPTTALRVPARVVDEDYDEGVADALMGLAGYRTVPSSSGNSGRSPPASAGSRSNRPSPPHPSSSHRGSVSSSRSHASSPPLSTTTVKRALSPTSDETSDSKRARMEESKRRASSASNSGLTPARHSPPPFRATRASHSRSPEERPPVEGISFPPSPRQLSVVLPPHPRPIGTGMSSHGASGTSGGGLALPPITTLSSPSSTVASPHTPSQDERQQAIERRSISPPSRIKAGEVTQTARSPPVKTTPSPPLSVHAAEPEQVS